jgi:hypothetical protein
LRPETGFDLHCVAEAADPCPAQVAELKAAGCTDIFQEKVSGAKPDRSSLPA